MRAFVRALHPERADEGHPREGSLFASGHARVGFADQDDDDGSQSATAAAEQHMVDTTASGDGNNSSSSSSAGERVGRINQRVSAIDRYMTLSAPQLFGTSSSVPSPSPSSTGTSQQPLGATFQVRASGAGSYTTMAVD